MAEGFQAAFSGETSMSEFTENLCKIEAVAEDILLDKSQLIELDRKRNQNREASRALTKSKNSKIWFCAGTTFVKIPTTTAQNLLKTNHTALETEITKIRDGLKEKIDDLYRLEGENGINPGFSLKSFQSP